MIKEAYCSDEVAQLLKEKGFPQLIKNLTRGVINDNKHFVIPTHQMAMQWLREEKYILIFIVPAKDESGNLQYMADVWAWNEDEGLYEPTWCAANHVYEKAIEEALKYSLENLI